MSQDPPRSDFRPPTSALIKTSHVFMVCLTALLITFLLVIDRALDRAIQQQLMREMQEFRAFQSRPSLQIVPEPIPDKI